MSKKTKEINQACFDCGKKHGQGDKTVMGMWQGICDICGKEKYLADAKHDFGIGLTEWEFKLSNSF